MRRILLRAGFPAARFSALFLALLAALAVGCRAQDAVPASPRAEFRKMLFADRAPVELRPQELSRSNAGSTRVERIRYTAERGHDAVALLYRPMAEGKYPAVIVQHFYGGTKDNFLFGSLLAGLAQKGIIGVAIDGRYRGERQNGKSLEAAMVEALRTGRGRPWLLDTAYDVLRLVDYLQTRPDVDRDRIGMSGISEGGIVTWMCAAADDRIRVAAPIIGVTCFADSLADGGPDGIQARMKLFEPVLLEHAKDLGETAVSPRVLRSAWEKLVPGSLDRFDAPSLLPQIAPRPLLILNHELDEIMPVAGARKAFEAARARYGALMAGDRLEFRVKPGVKHTDIPGLLEEAGVMVQWMERWLKGPA